ncbi:unnamed protein product, partial [Allacma fusca]
MESLLKKCPGDIKTESITENLPVIIPRHTDEKVLSILLTNSQDISLLKTFRLVSKSLNEVASAALRTHSFVLLEENEPDQVTTFRNLLVDGRMSTLPSPFQKFHVTASTLSDETFTTLINLRNFCITSFKLTIPDVSLLDRTAFEALLESKGSTMKEWSVEETPKEGEGTSLLLQKNKRLKFEDYFNPHSTHKEMFLKVFKQEGNFEKIAVVTSDSEVLNAVLTPDRLSHVQSIYLTLHNMGRELGEFLRSPVMPRVTVLQIYLSPSDVVLYSQQLLSLVKNVASTIEVLEMDFVPMTRFPVLPRLKYIHFLDWKDELGIFSPQRFPSLEHVSLCVSEAIECFFPKSGFQPNDQVQDISIYLDVSSGENPIMGSFYVLTNYLKRQFPTASCFQLCDMPRAISRSTFLAIHNSFPELKNIWLDGTCDFTSMSGMDPNLFTRYLENDLAVEEIPRKCSIFSFSKLEDLSLTAKVVVTNQMVTYCLSKIPSLRTLSFHW